MADINVRVGYTIDKAGLKQIQDSLRAISGMSLKNANPELKQAVATAKELEGILSQAFNPALGTVNLTKLNGLLKQNGLNAKVLQSNLAGAGSQGAAAFAKMQSQILKTNVKMKESSALLTEMAHTLRQSFKYSAAYGAVDKVTGVLRNAVSYTKQLDKSLNDIRIVTDKSAESMKDFAKYANQTAKSLGASTTDLSNAALIYYQQGLSDKESKARAETTIKAANVTGQTGQEVSEQLTAVWNGYRVTAEETELYVDKLAAVAAATAADLEELSTGMSKVASSASMMGVDIDQLSGILSTVTSVTRQAPESVGTAYRTIFTRMSDLRLGKTLEDGTTLGLVSEKLARAGVEVLDLNGNLRSTGDIITEIGEKWNTGVWSQAQKVALAQQIAGKRQYDQLNALLNNWDMYESALKVSQQSAGTLQHQQEIYMESIPAKLSELKATWQGVYGDLINTDELSSGIDMLTQATEVFDNFINAFGGGIKSIGSFGAILAGIFNKQISNAIVRQIENIKTFKENMAALKLQNEFSQTQEVQGTPLQKAEITAANSLAESKNIIAGLGKSITNEEREELSLLAEETAEMAKQTVLLRERHNVEAENLSESKRLTGLGDYFNGVRVDNKGNPQGDTDYLASTSEELKTQSEYLSNFERKAKGIYGDLTKPAQTYIDKIKEVGKATKNAEIGLDEYKVALQELAKAQENYENAEESEIEDAERQLNATKDLVEAKWEQVKVNAKLAGKDMKKAANLEDNAAQAGLRQTKLEAKEAQEQYALIQAQQKAIVRSTTTTLTSGLAAASSGVMMFSSIIKTLNNDTLSFGEKVEQVFMSLAFQLPMLISSISQVGQALVSAGNAAAGLEKAIAIRKIVEADGELAIAEAAAALATEANTEAVLQNVKAKLQDIIATEGETSALGKEAVALLENAEAQLADAKARGINGAKAAGTTNALSKGILTIGKSIGPMMLITAAVAALAYGFYHLYKQSKQVEDNFKSSSNTVTQLTQKYSDLESALDSLAQKQDKLDELVKGSTEWKNALSEVNDEVVNLLQTYPELYKYVQKTSEGELTISEEGKNEALKLARENITKAQLAKAYDSRALAERDTRNIYRSLSKHIAAGGFGGNGTAAPGQSNNAERVQGSYSQADSVQKALEKIYTTNPELFTKENAKLLANELGKEGIEGVSINGLEDNIDRIIKTIQESKAQDLSNDAILDNYIKERANQLGYSELSEASMQVVRNQIEAQKEINKSTYQSMDAETLASMYASTFGYTVNDAKALKFNINGEAVDLTKESVIDQLASANAADDILSGINNGTNEIVNAINNLGNVFGSGSGKYAKVQDGKYQSGIVGDMSAVLASGDASTGQFNFGGITNSSVNYLKQNMGNKPEDVAAFLGWSSLTDENLQSIAQAAGYEGEEAGKQYIEAFANAVNSYNTSNLNLENKGEWNDSAKQSLIDKTGVSETTINERTQGLLNEGSILSERTETNQLTNTYQELLKEKQALIEANKASGEEWENLNAKISEYESEVEDVVLDNIEFNQGLDELGKSFKANYEKISKATDFKDVSNELETVRKQMGEVLNVDPSSLSDNFIGNNLEKIKKLASGDISVLQSLRQEAAKDILLNIGVDENSVSDFNGQIENIMENLDGLEGLATLDLDITNFVNELVRALAAAGKTGEQISAILESMGVEADIDWQQVESRVQELYQGQNGSANVQSQAEIRERVLKSTVLKSVTYRKKNNTRNSNIPKGSSNKPSGNGGSPKKNKGGKGETKNDKDPYYRVDSKLAKINAELEKLNDQEDRAFGKDRIANLKKQSEEFKKQADLYKDRIAITKNELAKLRKENKYGFTFDENGISNYDAALSKIKGAKKYNEALEYAEKYQQTVQTLYDDQQNLNEAINSYYEANLKQVEYKIEFSGDFSEIRKEWNNFKKDVLKEGLIIGGLDFSESLGDALFAKENAEIIEQDIRNRANALQELGQRIAYAATQGADYRDPVYGDLNSMIELYKEKGLELKDLYGDLSETMNALGDSAVDTFDALVDNHKKYLDYLDKERSALETLAGIYTSLNGEIDYANQAVIDTAKLQNTKLKLDTATGNRDFYKAEYEKIYAQWKAATDAGNDLEAAELRKSVDSIESEYAEAMQEVAEITAQILEDALQLFTDSIKNTFEQTLSDLNGGLNSDQMTQDWEFSLGLFDEDHLDAYHAQRALEDLQKRFEDTIANSSITAQSRLNSLMNEQLDILREREYLTQYDVDRANKLLDIEIKRAALEDAQRNKSKLQLKRDSQGNYSYQFVADQEKLNQATEDLKKAQDELYELELGNVKSTSEQMRDIYKEAMEDMAAHANDSLEEQEKRWEYWQQRITNAANNVKIAVGDLDLDFSDWSYDTLQLTGSSVVEFAKNLSSDVFNGMFERIQEATAEYQKTKQEIQDTIAANGDIDQAIVNMVEPIRVLADRTKEEEELYNQAYFTAIQTISNELPTIAASLKDLAPSMGEIFNTLNGAYVGKMPSFDTGGYTGSWGSSGKLATLHEKELVLNATDTTNMLKAISLVRPISSLLGSLTNTMGSVIGGVGSSAQSINQNVNIKANFPGVNNSNEIEKAFNNLINMAAQRAYQF